jgi:hypothetical protein
MSPSSIWGGERHPRRVATFRLKPVVRSGKGGGEVEDALRPALTTGRAQGHVVRLLEIAGMMR